MICFPLVSSEDRSEHRAEHRSEHSSEHRVIKFSGQRLEHLVVAVGYAEVCVRHRCCRDNSFMRYEKLSAYRDDQDSRCYLVPNASKDGNPIVQIAFKVNEPFWEFYVPLARLHEDECSALDIKNEKIVVLRNSFEKEIIRRCY